MIYNCKNAGGASVYDVETKERLDHVMSIDTDAGEVLRAEHPARVVGGQLATFTQKFTTIYPIRGGGARPVLFHCYGRLPA
jgi:hypothetical protein